MRHCAIVLQRHPACGQRPGRLPIRGMAHRVGERGSSGMPRKTADIRLQTSGRHESYWIDDFERVIGEVHYLLLAQDLKRPANVNIGEAKGLTNLALT